MPSIPTEREELSSLVSLAVRRVATDAGARLYGKPIGSPIGGGEEAPEGGARPVTIERLKSLQAQFVEAKRTGNTALMKDIQSEFTNAVKQFREARPGTPVLSELADAAEEQKPEEG